MELSPKDKHLEFDRVLKSKSINQDDPISEWCYLKTDYGIEVHRDDGYKCICSQTIYNLHYIKNKVTGTVLHIGCECIKRWSTLKPTCNGCNITLGALERRRKQNDWLCSNCDPGNNTISFGFPWSSYFSKKFKTAVKDIPFVEKWINHSKVNDNHEKFILYAETYWKRHGYEIKDVEVEM